MMSENNWMDNESKKAALEKVIMRFFHIILNPFALISKKAKSRTCFLFK